MFEEHGKFTVEFEGDVLVVQLSGAFNAPATQALFNRCRELISQFGDRPFYELLNLQDFEGAVPEAWTLGDDYNEWLSTTTIVKKAVVTTSGFIAKMDQQQIPSQEKIETQFFLSVEPAWDWLRN